MKKILIAAALAFFMLVSYSVSMTSNLVFCDFARNSSFGIVTSTTLNQVNVKIYNTASSSYIYEENHSSVAVNELGLFTISIGGGTQVGSNTWASVPYNSGIWVMIACKINAPDPLVPIQSVQMQSLALETTLPVGIVTTTEIEDGSVTNADINDVAWSKVTSRPSLINSFAGLPNGTNTQYLRSNGDGTVSWQNAGGGGAETDPVFGASPAAGITNTNITNWNTAYGWGNHASAGYLTGETDPVFGASAAAGITNTNITNWNTAYGWGNHASAGYLTGETDPVFGASPAAGITNTNITNWNTAYGWGNHAGLYAPSSHVGATGTAHGDATTSVSGFMSGTDKTKLDAITGNNTGDQTISLTGEVTGSGTGSFPATISNNAVTSAKINDGAIVDADISGSAGITITKLAGGTSDGQVLTYSTSGGISWAAPAGGGGVTTFSGGSTGLTPNSASSGAITLAGILDVDNGGTGQTSYTDGQLLIGNSTGNTLSKSTLTAGNGISITNGNGSITISAPSSGVFIPSNFTRNSVSFSANDTWTVPAGVYTITIEAVGGSGGGGGSGADRTSNPNNGATGGGGGGGAGEYAGVILNVVPGDVIGVTIGSAGIAGTRGANSDPGNAWGGGNGGQTIVTLNSNPILTAHGGSGGAGSVGNSSTNDGVGGAGGNRGTGGTGSSDYFHTNGINGNNGANASDGNSLGNGGAGGSGPHATGLATNVGGTGGNGVYSPMTSAGNPGNAGSAGRVVISYY